jgi:rhodanese-related sulfurtransferase/peroxiredoxin
VPFFQSLPHLQNLPHLHNWKPLPPGSAAPNISLTAHDGTWVKSKDFKGETHLVLVFFRHLEDATVEAFFSSLDQAVEALEKLNAKVYGVNQNPAEKLRDYVDSHGLSLSILYDPLAHMSRGFRCSGRVRPYCKPALVIVEKDGQVAFAEHGYPSVEAVLQALAKLEGVVFEKDGTSESEARAITGPQAIEKLGAKESPYLLIDVRTKSEHDAYHPEGCVHIPVDELPNRYKELKQKAHFILVCQTGGEASLGAAFLMSVGFEHVYVVDEGMAGWTGKEGGGVA